MIYFNLSRVRNLLLCLSFLCAVSFTLHAQKHEKIWDALLANNRKEALQLINAIQVENDVESLVLQKLIRMENGIMKTDPNFISKVSEYPDYENYVFSNWNMTYLFTDYSDTGFNIPICKLPHLMDASKVTNSTVKNGLYYLQAVTNRFQRKWDAYTQTLDIINAIRDWEYCGVFENLNSSGMDMPYAPEEEASNKVFFDAKSRGKVQWYKADSKNEVYKFFGNHEEYKAGVHYAQTFVHSPIAQRVRLKIGKGGLIRVWLNDALVMENDETHITELDAYTYEVNLHKGVNRILVKSATNGEVPYFIVRLEDLQGKPLTNYKTSFTNRNYKKSTVNAVQPTFIPHSVEAFFEAKLKDPKSDQNLTKFCLVLSYQRNGRVNEALKLMEPWIKKYPQSSLLKALLMECYTIKGEDTTVKKLQNNIKRKDPNYYWSSLSEYEKADELLKLDITTYEAKLRKIATTVDYPFMKHITDMMINFRREDRAKMRKNLDDLLNDPTLPSKGKTTFAEFYSTVFNDDKATIDILEKYNKQELNTKVVYYLAHYYQKQNRIEETIELYKDLIKRFDDDNNFYYDIIKLLHDTGQYKRSLPYIDKALQNFPNSFLFTKLKGDAFLQIKKKKKAIAMYEATLERRPSYYKLRTKINDLKNRKNPLNDFELKDAYTYIKDNRNILKNNNYGLNTLFSQTNVLDYGKGGGEYKTTLIYEITSQNGIEIFKEHDVGLSGDYLIKKSEVVKPDGSTVPADRKGSKLVFDELAIGDVIYLDYEARYARYGRFYNDYILGHSFMGYHPRVKNAYRFLTKDKQIKQKVTNKKVNYKRYKKGELYVHEWELSNVSGIPISEDYMPAFRDVAPRLYVSSINSWNDIATWYSDIVRKQLKFDQTVQTTFKEIFPKGYLQLSETERAKRIYYYITDNLNYSHVSFRQSGYVPQKPSKTIKTKLGDCKDFSSLFLVLAQKAGLQTRMVLILTSDHGKNGLVLPSSSFNHCIVKVKIDGKEQFLELTDKYLPFKALPLSLREALALEIPFDSSGNFVSKLYALNDVAREKANFKSLSEIDLNKGESPVKLTTTVAGHVASYYIDILQNKKGKLLDNELRQEISNRASETVKFVGLENVSFQKEKGTITSTTKLTADMKINKVGSLLTFRIPYFLNPYNESIIQLEKRAYPIDYKKYENADGYHENIIIRLKENEEFVDIPENASYQFKGHRFAISYKLLKANVLKVEIISKVTTDTIAPEAYSSFKEYVRKVLDTRSVLVSYRIKK